MTRSHGGSGSKIAVVAGYFGFGNAGDEMILDALLRRIRSVRWTVFTPKGAAVSGADTADRFSPVAIARVFRRSRLLLFGGGEIFQVRTSIRSLLYYLCLILGARLFGCRLLVYGIGLDPDMPGWASRLTARVLSLAEKIWARDAFTAETLGAVSVVADPAWNRPVEPVSAAPEFPAGVLWILRFAQGRLDDDVAEWARSLNELNAGAAKVHGFLPLQPALDLPGLTRLRVRLDFPHRLETWRSLDDIFPVIRRYSAVVTMRYHGLVAAVLAGRACAVLSDHGKVLELARSLPVFALHRTDLSAASLTALLDRARSAALPDPEPWRRRAEAGLDALETSLAL